MAETEKSYAGYMAETERSYAGYMAETERSYAGIEPQLLPGMLLLPALLVRLGNFSGIVTVTVQFSYCPK